MAKSNTSKKRTRKTPLSRERVLTTAVVVADASGLKALSMRRLAQQLGVEAMSLYNHVRNKDDLLDGMVELVAGELTLPEADAFWLDAMRARAVGAHQVLMRHPWATTLFVSRAHVGPNMLRYVDRTIGCLRAAGFDWPTTDHAWNAIDSYVYGFTLQRLNFPFEPDEYADVGEEFRSQVPMEHYPHLMGMSAEVTAGRHDGLHELAVGLDLLLEGFARLRDGSD